MTEMPAAHTLHYAGSQPTAAGGLPSWNDCVLLSSGIVTVLQCAVGSARLRKPCMRMHMGLLSLYQVSGMFWIGEDSCSIGFGGQLQINFSTRNGWYICTGRHVDACVDIV
jgi:hypothetical protein